MKLYNSLTRNKEKFTPAEKTVTMYTCGPTVYHYAHVGNLRTYIMEDILEKYLIYLGYDLKRAMNITDVGHLTSDGDSGDDKMLLGAKREKKTVLEIAEFYTGAFFEDFEKLNIKKPDIVIPATSRINDYIDIISSLIQKGYAYESGGNVYFDTSKLSKYFVFSRHLAENLEVGVREDVGRDNNKKSPNDFVLWFTKSKFDSQELKWPSPWGTGYPGWHIECSAISIKELGPKLNIHCGGVDNAFPHHTNEIAQSEAFLGGHWCDFWFHVRHLKDETGKMSKSKEGALTLSTLVEKGYSPMVYRFFCLMSHYRKVLSFTFPALDNAKAAYEKLLSRILPLIEDKAESAIDKEAFEFHKAAFVSALGNDLNTSLAVTSIYDVLKSDTSGATKLCLIADFDKVLSLDLIKNAVSYGESQKLIQSGAEISANGAEDELKILIEKRTAAKKAKDFAAADKIRDKIREMGYAVEDTADGVRLKKL